MYDFTTTIGTGDWGVTIGTTPTLGGTVWGTGYPYPYPYPTQQPTGLSNSTNQLLMLGLVIVAAVLMLKK